MAHHNAEPTGKPRRMKLHFTATWLTDSPVPTRQLPQLFDDLNEFIYAEFENILLAFFAQGLEESSCSIKPDRSQHP